MKYAFIFITVMIFTQSCSKKTNQIIIDDKTNKQLLIVSCDREAFNSDHFIEWFEEEYNRWFNHRRNNQTDL